ncbi:MAG: 30S ribosomal protein S8e [Candidatus Micrarchaeota archaeon]
MVQYHKRAKSKASGSGGKRREAKDKSLCHYGGFFARTKLSKDDKEERKSFHVLGGKDKTAAASVAFANVVTKQGTKKTRIKNVLESPANRHFARENVITKGTLIDTELGKARVTSRPGQDGVINACLVEEAKV